MELPVELTTGERVARARIACGISQETSAALVGRSAGWMSKIERGILPFDRKSVLLKLAQVLDVDVLEGRSPTPHVSGIGRSVVVGEVRQELMDGRCPQSARPPQSLGSR